MGTELELKYILEPDRPWAVQTEILSLLRRAGYAAAPVGEKLQEDTYYDTPEDTLLLGGGSLRLRRKGEERVLTCKGPRSGSGGTFLRREDELVLTGEREEAAAFLGRALPGVEPGDLRAVLIVENLRRTYRVAAPNGAEFELAFDDVTYKDPASGRTARERQAEAERVRGTESDLERLAGVLAGAKGLRGAQASKYQRGRSLTGDGGELPPP